MPASNRTKNFQNPRIKLQNCIQQPLMIESRNYFRAHHLKRDVCFVDAIVWFRRKRRTPLQLPPHVSMFLVVFELFVNNHSSMYHLHP